MKFEPSYPPARNVAPVVEAHLVQSHGAAKQAKVNDLAPIPTRSAIEAMVDVTFWTSLRKEEGYAPKTSLVYLPPELSRQPIIFEERLPLNPKTVTKLAPAVERPGIQLGIWHENDEMYIWGATRELPALCLVVEVVEPGMLAIKHKRIDGFGKFFNVAILKGDEIKIVDESKALLPGSPKILASLLSFSTVASGSENVNVLVQMAVSMRAHNRGGMLLVVPTGSSEWKESIIQPISYAVSPAFSKLSELIKKDLSTVDPLAWQGALKQAVDGIAGLTAADGATIINDQYELLAFGAKVGRSDRSTRVERVIITEPVEGNTPQVMHPAQNGGTRHLSAAQFVHDQHNAIALVASQDGRFTIFAWSEIENMVHAHRVDVLFL